MVFLAAVFLMTVELTASRLVAPYLGNSLYTWTIIIGVILAGVSLGNYWGGRLIDRKTDFCLLSDVLIASSVLVFLIIFLKPLLAYSSFFRWFFPLRVLFCVSLLFLAPAVGLGMVLPAVTRLRLETIKTGGKVVGGIYALSSLGSIFGTFMTGFFLIPYLGSIRTILICSWGLLGLGWLVSRKRVLLLLTLFLLMGIYSFLLWPEKVDPKSFFEDETGYYWLAVTERKMPLGTERRMVLDNAVQGGFFKETGLCSSEYLWASLLGLAYGQPERILFIGGGPYLLPKQILKIYPKAQIEVLEIDPEVTWAANKFFGPIDTRIKTFFGDGRVGLKGLGKYDFIYVDAYSAYASIPFHLTTREFFKEAKEHLVPGGIFAANLISAVEGDKSDFLRSYAKTVEQAFPYMVIIPTRLPKEAQNVIIIGFRDQKKERVNDIGQGLTENSLKYLKGIVEDYRPQGGLVLADDLAPVERLTLPLLR